MEKSASHRSAGRAEECRHATVFELVVCLDADGIIQFLGHRFESLAH